MLSPGHSCPGLSYRKGSTAVRKGSIPGDGRGNSYQRKARKRRLFARYGIDGVVTCFRCDVPMLWEDCTIDRIIPGAHSGRYVDENCRPCCQPCNSETGNDLKKQLV